MPPCSEKSIISLIYYISLKLADESILSDKTIQVPDQIEETIQKELDDLTGRLKAEKQDSEKVKNFLEQCRVHVKILNWSLAKPNLEMLLKELKPFDIQDMLRLIKKTDESAELITGQDIILLLGGTGSGKSTTIHYMAGSKMAATRVRELNHIAPVEVTNLALKNVVTSPHAMSETRYITSVPVNFKDIGIQENGGIVLCDTPGFLDTAGPEVDIANGIGLVRAIKKCKSVRPLLLISYKSIGDRLTGLKESAYTLVRLIPNIQDHFSSFSYGFTKYPEIERDSIHASLKDILDTLSESEKSNTAFCLLLGEMAEQTEDGANVIDPVGDESPKVLVKKLKRHSKTKIQDQLQKEHLAIICATKRADYPLIKYKLDELKDLQDVLKQDFIEQVYDDCIQHVSQHIHERYTETVSLFNRCLENQNMLTIDDIEQYQVCINHIAAAESLREVHLGSKTVQRGALIQNLITKVDIILKGLRDADMDDSSIKTGFDNVKLLSTFPDVDYKYKEICQHFFHRFTELVKAAEESILSNKFDQVAQSMTNAHLVLSTLGEHLKRADMEEMYKNIISSLLTHLRSVVERINTLLKTGQLDEFHINKLKDCVSILESAMDTIVLRDHVRIQDIKNIYESSISAIVNYFEKLCAMINNSTDKEINNSTNKEIDFMEMKRFVNEMNAIRTISALVSRTSESYHSTIERLIGGMQQLRRDAEQLLRHFDVKTDSIDYTRLFRYLAALENAEWIDSIRPGVYADVMRNIVYDILQYVQSLQASITTMDLDLEHFSNIENASKLVRQIDYMQPCEKSIPEFVQYRQNVHLRFDEAITSVFNFIKKTYNVEEESLYKQKEILQKFEEDKMEYDKLHPARLYLSKNGYQNVEALENKITCVENERKLLNLKDDQEICQLEVDMEKLRQIALKCAELPSKSSSSNPLVKTQSDKYLQDNGYENIDVLLKCKSDKATQLAELQQTRHIKAEEYKEVLEKLNVIRDEYYKLHTKGGTSSEGQSFLHQRGYENIGILENKIKCKKQEIKERASDDQAYVFSRLDGITAENALQYVEICKKVPSIKEKAHTSSRLLSDFMQGYSSFIQTEMDRCFNRVTSADQRETSQEQIFNNAQLLTDRLQEIIELEENCPNVSRVIKGSQIRQKWSQKLSDNLTEMDIQMKQYAGNHQNQQLKSKLDIAKSLSQLDIFLPGNKTYLDLYRTYQESFYQEFRDVHKQVMKYIENHDYVNVGSEMSNQDDGPNNQRALDQLNRSLCASVADLVEETQTRAIMLGSNMETKAVTSIVDNLRKIKNAKTFVSNYLDQTTQEKISSCIEEIESIVSGKIMRFLDSIEALVKANNFYEAETSMEYIIRIRQLIGTHFIANERTAKNVTERTEQLQNNLKQILDDVEKKYKNMSICDYIFNPPKEILDKLQQVACHNLKYNQALSTIIDICVNKFRESLRYAREGKRKDNVESNDDLGTTSSTTIFVSAVERNEIIRDYEAGLWSLPENLKNILEKELDNFKKDIEHQEKNNKNELDGIIQTDNISSLGKLMKKYEEQGMQNLACSLREEVLKKVEICKTKIDDDFDDNTKLAFNEAKKLYEYNEVLGKTIPEIERTYSQVWHRLVKTFNKLHECLMCIKNVETPELVEKSFDIFVAYINFRNEFTGKAPLPDNIDQKTTVCYIIAVFRRKSQKLQ
ncbi:unnamed protein product [Didymodactylos carnosus]|uniref:Uncharacterized protein n=1 Tax=Didymodactylos carnosus TaxID=1234261 RepID=A0A8S2J492_9BILA|nr:unnamed protein product [Didymodactylos carnosus]CAF3782185.1 unnamed protein product [Didymodactylos carnosus]